MSLKTEPLVLSDDDRRRLRGFVESEFAPARLQLRARLLLGAAEGLSNHDLASQLSVSRPTVIKWRRHYLEHGLDEGLFISRSPSDRRAVLRKQLEILDLFFGPAPYDALSWTIEGAAKKLHVSKDYVQRTLNDYGVSRSRFRRRVAEATDRGQIISGPDPFFGRRILAVVGLYYETLEPALAFAVDPQLLISEDRNGGDSGFDACEIDALRSALTSLEQVTVAGVHIPMSIESHGLEVTITPGRTLSDVHPAAVFLEYLNHLDRKVPVEHDVHLVLDRYGVASDASVKAWLSAHPRFLPRFSPGMLWRQFVESWFDLIQGSGRTMPVYGVREMAAGIEGFVSYAQGKTGIRGPIRIM